MKTAMWVGLGALGGFAVAFLIKQPSKEWCCKKVAEGARDKVTGACGPLGAVCGAAWDALGLGEHSPSILERLGL